MHYRLQRKRKHSKRLYIAIAVGVIFLILLITNTGVPDTLVRVVHSIGTPFWRTQPTITYEARGILQLFKPKGNIIAENQQLKNQYQEVQKKLIDYSVLKEEYENLSNIIGRSLEKKFTLASVLLRPNASPYDTLVIDIGSKNGVGVGNAVFVTNRTYIGLVDEVYTNTARVRLLSSPGFETTVLLGNTDIQFTAIGKGGGNMLIEAPRDISVAIDDYILLPGLPQSIVGVIGSIESRPVDAMQTLFIYVPLNIYTLSEVFIEI